MADQRLLSYSSRSKYSLHAHLFHHIYYSQMLLGAKVQKNKKEYADKTKRIR